MWTWLLQLHTKLTNHQPLLREVIYPCYFLKSILKNVSFFYHWFINDFFLLLGCWNIIYIQFSTPSFAKIVQNVMCQILLLQLRMAMCIVMCVVWKQPSRRLVSYEFQLCQQLEIMLFLPLRENGWKLWVCRKLISLFSHIQNKFNF